MSPIIDHRNGFNFLRVLLASCVIFSHSFCLTKTPWLDPVDFLTHHQFDLGDVSVNAFFIISGFVISASWERSVNVGQYFIKRILRIYPGFIAACLFCALIAGPFGAASPGQYFRQFQVGHFLSDVLQIKQLLHLPPTFLHNRAPNLINCSVWTIKIEFECYLLIPCLAALGIFRQRIIALVIMVSFLALNMGMIFHFGQSADATYSVVPHVRFLSYFLAGMTFYLYRDRIAYSQMLLWASIIVLVLTGLTNGLPLVMPIFGSYLLLYAAFHCQSKIQTFGRTTDLSYGLYLYAWPVQQLIVSHGGYSLNPYWLFLTAMALTCPLAVLSWYGVEKPCLRLKPDSVIWGGSRGLFRLRPAAGHGAVAEKEKVHF